MKTFTVLTTLVVAVSVLISGCSISDPGPDLDRFANALGAIADTGDGYNIGVPGGYGNVYGPAVWIDSLSRRSESTAIFWGHYQYDNVLIIQKGQLNYWEDTYPMPSNLPVMRKLYVSEPYTIDFRTLPDSVSWRKKEWIYKFSVSVDSLKSNTSFRFCITADYQDQNTTGNLSTCNSFMTK